MQIYQGIDIASVRRMEQTIRRQGRAFINRIFTRKEQTYCESRRMKFEHYAARFAAKEAFLKALSSSNGSQKLKSHPLSFLDIEILRRPNGKPFLHLSMAAKKASGLAGPCQLELSLAHERDLAVATVLVVLP